MKPAEPHGNTPGRDAAGADDIAAKVRFLSEPASYPDRPQCVEVIETHFAWVFLSGRLAYKLKKPIRFGLVNLTSLEARRRSCDQEVVLNRRLAETTYLGVEALTLSGGGGLALGGADAVVDWLVKMVRLPAARMMDNLLRESAVTAADLTTLVTKLVRFDAAAPLSDGQCFRERIAQQLRQARAELLAARDMDQGLAGHATERALRYMQHRSDRFAERLATGRIRGLHGDLRPEHVCLLPDPQIIDCLEFDETLRSLDCAQEMAFLAMECHALGDDTIWPQLLGQYRQLSGDQAPADLLHFYLGERAIVRAMLAIRHLTDPAITDTARWPAVARKYLRLATGYLERIPDPLLAAGGLV